MGLIWLVLAGVVVWALVRLGRQTEGPRRGQWRVAATLVSAALLAGGALALSKGAWIIGAGLTGAALWLVLASRIRTVLADREAVDDSEARSILGVPADATPEAISAAWRRLMGRAHPDQGGTEGLAARLNAARDRLLRK
ncbi:MAG: molecular chaperone DnaJ [Brevundimonas sp.]|uniref:J domain-containing protein n=1 Tax=Brevundimonas sp. TaxID=1871086 RepID=UPI00273586E4|nr:molecular chaperone DnaJ [Brevundimonas sp.]MBX9617393.1 molecular chaperone DnaJ [Caulobacteraceae bacterium]MDP3405947.1 molecular chaperone DnaJ [Brevundimonas sp.]